MFSSEVDYIEREHVSPTPVPLLYLTVLLMTAEELHTLEHSKDTATHTQSFTGSEFSISQSGESSTRHISL